MAEVAEVALKLNSFDADRATFVASHGLDPQKIVNALRSFGCAWIKRLFAPGRLAEFDAVITENIEGIENVYADLGLARSFNAGFPLYFASEANRAKAQDLFKSTYPQMFDPARMVGADTTKLANFVFDAMRAANLNKAVIGFLGMKRLYTSAALCHIRSFKPNGVAWFGEFHQDNKLYRSSAQILTLWFPFRYQYGPMPSLEFLPVSLDSHLPTATQDGCGIDNALFDNRAFWRPAYQLGDAMLLTGFVAHRTYVEPHMTLERTSVDFRFFSSEVPAPIYPPKRYSFWKSLLRRDA